MTSQYWKRAVVIEKFEYRRYMIELENGKRLVRNRRHLRLTTKPKHSNMTKTNHKQDITSNDSEENIEQQQPDMAERQPRLKRITDMVNGNSHKMNTSDFCMYGGC